MNILAIVAFVMSIIAYIQYLRVKVQSHEIENARLKSQAKASEWDRQIKDSKIKINEEVKDFEDAKKAFHDKYGTATSMPNPGPNPDPKSDT